MAELPARGVVGEPALPRLLLKLHLEGWNGTLVLRRGRVEKRVGVCSGAPVNAESNVPRESLAAVLEAMGTISGEERMRVVEFVNKRECREEKALIALKLVGPKELLLGLRECTRRRLLETFSWDEGEWSLDPDTPPPQESKAMGLDPLDLVREGLSAHWRPDRILSEFGERLSQYPVTTARFDAVARRLRGADALIQRIDGKTTAWEVLQGGSEASELGALWLLDASGAVELRGSPLQAAEPTVVAPDTPEIEILLSGSEQPAAGGTAAAQAGPQAGSEQGERARAMREEVLEKHRRLEELSYYELLGVDRDARLPQIKKAYLLAAKRFHPDALSRLQLDDVKAQANEVFAAIAKAHGILSNREERQAYDNVLDGHEEIDLEKVAQAEVLFRKGEILLKSGNFAGSLDLLAAAVQLWPKDSLYQSSLGWALYRKNPPELEQAREHLQQAVALDEGDALAHLRLGTLLKGAGGDPATGARHIARARALDPNIKA